MAISFVGQASSTGTSVTLPGGTQVDDRILVFAFRGTTGQPNLPAGYTNIFSQSANGLSFRLGYRVATGSDTSGTWTNADFVIANVYRGVSAIGGAGSNTNASAANTTIPGIGVFTQPNGTSWAVSYGGSLQGVSMSTPATTTLRSTQANLALSMAICVDSNGGVSSWGQKMSTNGVSAAGGGGSVELVAATAGAVTHNLTLLGIGLSDK